MPICFSFSIGFDFVVFVQLDDSLFVGIEVGQSVVVDDPDGAFTVTAFDANHCPGNSYDWDCNLFLLVNYEGFVETV